VAAIILANRGEHFDPNADWNGRLAKDQGRCGTNASEFDVKPVSDRQQTAHRSAADRQQTVLTIKRCRPSPPVS
jgi:hypothetical protein